MGPLLLLLFGCRPQLSCLDNGTSKNHDRGHVKVCLTTGPGIHFYHIESLEEARGVTAEKQNSIPACSTKATVVRLSNIAKAPCTWNLKPQTSNLKNEMKTNLKNDLVPSQIKMRFPRLSTTIMPPSRAAQPSLCDRRPLTAELQYTFLPLLFVLLFTTEPSKH